MIRSPAAPCCVAFLSHGPGLHSFSLVHHSWPNCHHHWTCGHHCGLWSPFQVIEVQHGRPWQGHCCVWDLQIQAELWMNWYIVSPDETSTARFVCLDWLRCLCPILSPAVSAAAVQIRVLGGPRLPKRFPVLGRVPFNLVNRQARWLLDDGARVLCATSGRECGGGPGAAPTGHCPWISI